MCIEFLQILNFKLFKLKGFKLKRNKMVDLLAKPLELSYVRHVPASGADPDKSLVICHGIFSSKRSWESIGKQIADQTKRIVYCLDLRDHGDSPFSDEEHGEFTYEGIVSDLVNFLRTHDIEQAVLLGVVILPPFVLI